MYVFIYMVMCRMQFSFSHLIACPARKVGVYDIDARLVQDSWQQLDLTKVDILRAPRDLRLSAKYFQSGNPDHAVIGDYRISFYFSGITAPRFYAGPQEIISVIGGMTNETISGYIMSYGTVPHLHFLSLF